MVMAEDVMLVSNVCLDGGGAEESVVMSVVEWWWWWWGWRGRWVSCDNGGVDGGGDRDESAVGMNESGDGGEEAVGMNKCGDGGGGGVDAVWIGAVRIVWG